MGRMTHPDDAAAVTALITTDPLSTAVGENTVWTPQCGAVVSFSGIVRNHDQHRAVESLSYTAHPSAEEELLRVAHEVADQHPGVRIWVGHRTGHLTVGDHALVAVCASAHRAQSFTACAALVEQIKTDVPIWKQQVYSDGSAQWLGLDDITQ